MKKMVSQESNIHDKSESTTDVSALQMTISSDAESLDEANKEKSWDEVTKLVIKLYTLHKNHKKN
jgi:hypothetical protein